MRIIALVFLLPVVLSAQVDRSVNAKINYVQEDIFVQIDVMVENEEPLFKDKMSYHILSLVRIESEKNFDRNERRGQFELLPNEKKTIASHKLNLRENEELRVYLFVRDKDRLVAQDSIKINEVVTLLKTDRIDEEEIEILGLVVENAKTKMGKDFYDFFYQKYNASGAKYPFIINIEEKPFIGGRGALISVVVEDQKLFEFQARPDEELLMNAAEYSLTLIANYAKTRNTVEKVY